MPFENQTNLPKDALMEREIFEVIQQANEAPRVENIIRVTEEQEEIVKKLCVALGLSLKTIVNSAIKYALFYAKAKGVPLYELEEYPKSLGVRPLKVMVTAETSEKLKESGMTEKLIECAVTGIQLLYKGLIKI
jgi:hypothetical protein